MRVINGLEAYVPAGGALSLAHGTFDGLHLGHQAVLEWTCRAALAERGEAAALTFDPHPQKVIAPHRPPFLLSTLDERLSLFARTGIGTVIVVRFDDRIRALAASAWLDRLERDLRVRRVVISLTHAFGRDREGTSMALVAWGAPRGVDVTVVPPVTMDGVTISSSAIRDRIRAGDVRTAAVWLGRWYSVRGEVVTGSRRGRDLGYPTANLRVSSDKLIPANGIYAAYATVGDATHAAAVSIGVRPTFRDGGDVRVEAHLLDLDQDLYGQELTLSLVDRLRDEVRFDSISALKQEMQRDVEATRRILESKTIHDVG